MALSDLWWERVVFEPSNILKDWVLHCAVLSMNPGTIWVEHINYSIFTPSSAPEDYSLSEVL